MALSRVKTWIAGETLTAADLNAEFSNILDNPTSLISPLSATLDLDGNQLTLDSDADTTITADTDDRIDFALSGTDLFRMDGTATTPVNGLTLIARAAGSKPSLQALTSDANEGLDLRDDNGNEILILSSVASAANEITITAAAAGNEPSIAATGDDTDIDITLTPKGAGNVNVSVGTLQIGGTDFLIDEDDMSSDSATRVPSQQSAKAYVDTTITLPRGYIDGLVMSNGTDTDHDIDIAAGECRDSADAADITLSAITKQIDATWSAGTNAGGLSSSLSAPANDTWYHVHAIIVGGSADVGFDTSITAANLVSDHSATAYRRIGSVLTDGSANIIAFVQDQDEFLWVDPPLDVDTSALSTTAVLYTLSVPTGDKVRAIINVRMSDNVTGEQIYISSPDVNDEAPSTGTNGPLATIGAQAVSVGNFLPMRLRTDTSAQVRARATGAIAGFQIATLGWVDPRGRNE